MVYHVLPSSVIPSIMSFKEIQDKKTAQNKKKKTSVMKTGMLARSYAPDPSHPLPSLMSCTSN